MVINKKLVWEISEYVVSVQALTPSVIMQKYKITRGKIDAIVEIMVSANIAEFISLSEPYKVIPQNKNELRTVIENNNQIIDAEIEKRAGNQRKKQDAREKKSTTEILEYLKRIETRLDKIENQININR